LEKPARNLAIDTYRGFVMLLMMAEVVQLSRVAKALPGNGFWNFLAYHQTHVEWAGCSLHDTIQPGFSFLVGVALPYSIAARIAKGGTFGSMFLHALWRSLLLIALGVFLRSTHAPQTYYTFEDTLSQIGLGYPLLFLLAYRPPRWQWAALGVLLFGYWLAWALYPAQPSDSSRLRRALEQRNNFGNAFDVWFLNLFPTVKPYVANSGGYLTLSFIPTLGTMILGLAAGRWLRDASPSVPMRRLLAAGAIGIAAGLLLHFTGICPVVKRIWTPAWTLFSGGLCFLFLAGFCWLTEVKGYRKWAFPLVVIGANSIAAYLMAHLWERFILDSFRIHLGAHAFAFAGTEVEPFVRGVAVLLVYWALLYWMFRRKLFLKI
jgi:predicted acyltransferase